MRLIETWRRDRRGTVTILFAASAVAIFASAALALDLITIWNAKRKLQSAVDIAAILAAANPAAAAATARTSLADNGFSAQAPTAQVTVGSYVATATTAVAARFVANAVPINAARVALSSTVGTTFSRVLGLPSSYPINAIATGATAKLASFTLGSRLLSVEGGIANALLGALTGQTISLTVMDYNALANARVDGTGLLDALALRANITAASYEEVASANVSLGQVLTALRTTVPGGSAAEVLGRLSGALGGSTVANIPVSSLINFGDVPLPPRALTSGGPAIPVLATILNAAAIANGARQVSIDLGPSIPGLLETRITVSIGEKRQSSGLVSVGSPKSTIRTAQTRILIEAKVNLVGVGKLSLPVYVEAASAVGTLVSVSCPWTDAGTRSVSVEARPGVVQLAVADVATASIDPSRPSPSFSGGGRILALPLLSVTGFAQATWDAPHARTLTFTESDITNRTARSVASSKPFGSLTGHLLSTLRLELNGFSLLDLLVVRPLIISTLQGLAGPIDSVLDATLSLLGIQLGIAEVTVEGTRCDQAVLVQ
ncbi:TadG family pilus assembly protein [Enterovirga rhinocerotis]|uniref:Putative membrane protein n=1 Tax=Enterovirga rhinocerotis TaxID=1339210 RepID=A0A4R7BY69_9HYPH|nr:TadG family pilus assembly protein [Enterovirga rhinocerotis]TDR90493.1 putative membrane protein [Enterovirga rhinocerotis]